MTLASRPTAAIKEDFNVDFCFTYIHIRPQLNIASIITPPMVRPSRFDLHG